MEQKSRGIGSHKHGISGHSPPTPGNKMQRAREANKLAELEKAKKPGNVMYISVKGALCAAKTDVWTGPDGEKYLSRNKKKWKKSRRKTTPK